MTSTEFTVGLNDGSRISSKVLKPPGGGSSDIFGLGNSYHTSNPSSEKQSKAEDSSTHSRVFGGSNSTLPQSNGVQSNVFQNGNHVPSKQNKKTYIRRNPITGEEIEMNPETENDEKNCDKNEDKEEESPSVPTKAIQTSIRVRNPPGGKSSGIF